MKIRNVCMSGAVNGVWVKSGDVLDVSDEDGARYVEMGYAVEVVEKKAEKPAKVEHAVAPAPETAALTTENVETPVKRSPGRPRKTV